MMKENAQTRAASTANAEKALLCNVTKRVWVQESIIGILMLYTGKGWVQTWICDAILSEGKNILIMILFPLERWYFYLSVENWKVQYSKIQTMVMQVISHSTVWVFSMTIVCLFWFGFSCYYLCGLYTWNKSPNTN